MKITDLLRLLRKHIILLLLTPVLLAGLVIYLTKTPSFKYSSETTLYTGIASGSSVEMGKSLNYFATNTDFDNLINVINSRETQQEVAIRLLAQHLMLPESDPRYISGKSFQYVREITPPYIESLIVKSSPATVKVIPETAPETQDIQGDTDPSNNTATFSFSKPGTSSRNSRTFPASIDPVAFEQTVKNLTELAQSSDTNFVYNLLNYNSPHYSISEISDINVQRIANSDLVKLKFTSDDPGICQQTLLFFTEVCIKNYKNIKENSSDAVVKYFEFQVNQATRKLKTGEDKLLQFNKGNNIINYYEQSKAVALAKEQLDVDYNNMRIKLAGTEAAIKRLEEKLEKQQKIQLQSGPILEKRNQLSQINTKIATAEIIGYGNTTDGQNLASLKLMAEKLKEEIRIAVTDLYRFSNTTEGLPVTSLLNEWITNVISCEDTRAGLGVLSNRIQEFQKQYEIYAPAGANLKRIEREISVSEQEFLELLHGLNLAKLKMQDIELSSNLKSVDPPFYPLTPNPTKRKVMIIGAALFGFIVVLTTILALEFFDETLRNPKKAAKILNLAVMGVFPRIYLKPQVLNFPFITQRLLEIIVQRIELLKNLKPAKSEPYQILLFSTLNSEGKTVIARNLAAQLKKYGNKVIVIRYSQGKTNHLKSVQDYNSGALIATSEFKTQPERFSFINWLLGYSDTRIDYNNSFLEKNEAPQSVDEYFEYEINKDYHQAHDYKELLINNNHTLSFFPDYILIEIPPILYYSYPAGLVASADLPLMVCRANRVWSQADQGAVENMARITSQAPVFVLNGVELEVMETELGELPKKRGWLQKLTKNKHL